jgi:hypothetical protein
MYRPPASKTPLLFGDIFSPDWLYDAAINKDAVRLGEFNARGGMRAYQPLPAEGASPGNKDFILAHGERCRAVILADDCEIETCLVRRGGRGRLLFAAITPWPTDPNEVEQVQNGTTFRRHPLEPGEHFDGGVVELGRLFAVNGRALTSLGSTDRVACMANEARAALEQRWAAFATRRGPLAAVDNATKLAHLLDAGDDPARIDQLVAGNAAPGGSTLETAKSVARAFTQAWKTEGEVMQGIADAHEARQSGHGEVAELEDALRALADMASAAADALQDHRAA